MMPLRIEHEKIPDRPRLDSSNGRNDGAEVLADIKTSGHAGQNSRGMNLFGQDPGNVRSQQRDGDLTETVFGQA